MQWPNAHQKGIHAHLCGDSWRQEWEAAGWTVSTAMTQNRQVRLDGNTSRPPSSDPLPPERVYHCNNLQPATHTGHQLFQHILHSDHYTMSPELKHVSTQTSNVLCNCWWHLTKGQSVSHQIALFWTHASWEEITGLDPSSDRLRWPMERSQWWLPTWNSQVNFP